MELDIALLEEKQGKQEKERGERWQKRMAILFPLKSVNNFYLQWNVTLTLFLVNELLGGGLTLEYIFLACIDEVKLVNFK